MITVTLDENGEIPLTAFAKFIDISKVVYYSLEVLPDETIKVSLFDVNKELLKIDSNYEKKEPSQAW